jgi:mannose-6-phosphate isomerase-like protein (cupin superfamily)
MIQKINLAEKLSRFSDHWHPRIVAELNGQQVKVAKLLGPFEWHHHEHEDELFLVVHGQLRIELRDGTVDLGPGECAVVPRGVEHRPVADEEVHLVLFEPDTTLHTGNIRTERTRDVLDYL